MSPDAPRVRREARDEAAGAAPDDDRAATRMPDGNPSMRHWKVGRSGTRCSRWTFRQCGVDAALQDL